MASPCALILLATAHLLPRAPPVPPLTTAAAIRLDPRVERRSGNEVLWQLPPGPGRPLAAVFVSPGCTIRATDFFKASLGCPRCAGLPEERRFTREALRPRPRRPRRVQPRRVLVPRHRRTAASGDGSELGVVKEEHPELGGLPLIGISTSSGGYFVSALAARVKFSSVVIMTAAAMEEIPAGYPPALFVHMPKDAERAQMVRRAYASSSQSTSMCGTPNAMPFAVSSEFLAERIPGLTRTVAGELVDVLSQKSFLNEKRFLKREGECLAGGVPAGKHVTEELNVAYAYHEFTTLKNGEIFKWFESHMDRKV